MTKNKKFRKALLVWVVLLCVGSPAEMAQAYTSYTPIDNSRRDYSAGASRKLGRGLANAGLGWTDIFKGMEDVNEEKGFWAGATWGPLYGAVNAVKRTGLGLYETVTFPFEGPNHFDPVIEPEFPLSDK